MASPTAPEPIYPPDHSIPTVIEKDRDNKEILLPSDKEKVEPLVVTPASDIEIQKGFKARRSRPWKWIFGILIVALCMLAIGIGIGYAIGNSNNSGNSGNGASR